jgi:hypothetical protein
VRFAPRPLPFDLSHASREEVMDRHPWTYRVMAEEMLREEKITQSAADRTLNCRPASLLVH